MGSGWEECRGMKGREGKKGKRGKGRVLTSRGIDRELEFDDWEEKLLGSRGGCFEWFGGCN